MSSPGPDTAGSNPPRALEISGLTHAFGQNKALDDVNFTIDPSRFCVLLGLNGAGKTTLFSLVTRLYSNTSGAIRVYGHDVRRSPGAALQRLGVVFQQRTLDLDLTVMQNLLYHAALHGFTPREARARAESQLERVKLLDRAKDKARRLSGGQMRRVEIARALLHDPQLLLLDEPTVGLDIDSRRDILERTVALCQDDQLAVLWATHLIDEVTPESQIVMLHHGKVVADGSHDAVLSGSATENISAAFAKLTQDKAVGSAAA
ncbi:ABC transporter ATP-binding protein [Pelagibius sp. Alg239-R121]|uniref:ABC transporter ATP-binding protein n=1 Tax=Pelagibius sp. Alg239-R121 TaxID=2993448 RepID=UPI0024A70CCB|nr:ABC transporter ATP-binding protein [Pelagibius sp. Alg239-R121]